jgi:hypothetical protein
MRQRPQHYWKKAIAAVHACVDTFQIEAGESGEEYVLMVLSAAADGAATDWHSQDPSADTIKPVKASSWLKALLRQLNEPHLDSHLKDMLEWADNYVINFTHFVTMTEILNDGNKLAHRDLVQAYLRHAAIRGASGQWKWDLIVPVYRGGPGAPFDARLLSYIVIQVKNKARKDSAHWHADFSTGIASFAGDGAILHTRLCIWLDLHAPERELDIRWNPQPPTTGMTLRPRAPEPARYNLRVSGHSQNIYEPLHKIEGSEPSLQMAALIGSMRAYGSQPLDESGLDIIQIQRDRAFCQGLFLP